MITPVSASSSWSPVGSPPESSARITQVSLPRFSAACLACKNNHLKCDGNPGIERGLTDTSCSRCVRKNLICTFGTLKAPLPPILESDELQFPMDDVEPVPLEVDIFNFSTPAELQYLEELRAITQEDIH